jgi:hypothetical protein
MQRHMLRGLALVVAVPLATCAALPAIDAATAVAAGAFDGTAPSRAAASCYEIKQLHPESADGVYYLQTPAMMQPIQFYCDMTTDGGGWVLIGRGREGWTFNPNGQKSASAVRSNIDTPAGFAPAALATKWVDGLLNNGAPSALADGVRIRRSRDIDGDTWQEVRVMLRDLPTWSWAFGGGHRITEVSFDNATYDGLSTSTTTRSLSTMVNNDARRMTMYAETKHNIKAGYAYGSSIRGNTSSSSYLWEYASEGYALPMAQMWLRPTLMQADLDYPTIPDSGLPAVEQRSLVNSRPEVLEQWGVTGLDNGQGIPILKALVTSFAQVGDRMIVGGKYLQVRQTASGTPIDQPYLAAFDVDTGEWISDFLPEFDGPVWALRYTPQGRLIVGGEFDTVNGESHTGLVALDPLTGAIDPTWGGGVKAIGDDTFSFVKSMDVQGDWLYVTGKFNQITGANPVRQYSAGRAGRFLLTTGQPDLAWRPRFNGLVYEMDASDQGDRVWAAGYFTTVNGVSRRRVTAVDTVNGTEIPGLAPLQWSWNSTKDYQQAIVEYGDRTFLGGSEHNLHMTDRSDMSLIRPHQTALGGDFQTIGVLGGVVYAACHCDTYRTWRFADVNKRAVDYPGVVTYTRTDPINYIGAWDAETLDPLPDFHPEVNSTYGTGAWELFNDDDGCLWIGGDVKPGRDLTAFWFSGFSKHCPRDSVAPSTPVATWSRPTSRTFLITWEPSVDDRGGAVTYEILNDSRVIATTTATSYSMWPVDGPGRFFVRAFDAAGNRSATTPILGEGVTPPDPV